jgi:hypothetical protein
MLGDDLADAADREGPAGPAAEEEAVGPGRGVGSECLGERGGEVDLLGLDEKCGPGEVFLLEPDDIAWPAADLCQELEDEPVAGPSRVEQAS